MDSGTKVFRSKFLIKERKILDCEFYKAYPVMAKFCLPGDLWKISSNIFIRLQPMLSPSLTPMAARLRYFFVPLRLVESNTELIITGSEDGYWSRDKEIPEFSPWRTYNNESTTAMVVTKGSLIEIMTGLPPATYAAAQRQGKHWPADYWRKGYARIWWDFYRDENLFSASYNSVTKFDQFLSWTGFLDNNGSQILPVCLPHDYFTSSLPWQLKGVAPAMSFGVSGLTWNGTVGSSFPAAAESGFYYNTVGFSNDTGSNDGLAITGSKGAGGTQSMSADDIDAAVQNFLDNVSGQINGAFTMADFRDMGAQTRVFERLARCGSRYTEYLRANFNTSPADETLQRAQYLGGYKVPILTTEVLQTAGAVNSSDEQTPVGTLRGKGITNGGDSIRPFFCKEFGMLYAILDVRPSLQYTQGVPREFTYRSRFDFFNPSFQHLSEQEVRNGELYFGNDKSGDVYVNDQTFGFQAYANELRTGKTMIVGDMRDSLDFWNQALKFASRPALNWSLLNGTTHSASWNRPFEVVENTQPIIADVYNFCEAHRPMVRYGTPGLVDHL